MDRFDIALETGFDDTFKLIKFPPSRHSSALVFSPQEEVQSGWKRHGNNVPDMYNIKNPMQHLLRLAGKGRPASQVSIQPHIIYHYVLSSAYRRSSTSISTESLSEMLFQTVSGVVTDLLALSMHHPALLGITSPLVKCDKATCSLIAADLCLMNGMRKFLVKIRNTCQHSQVNFQKSVPGQFCFDGLSVEISYPIVFFMLSAEPDTVFLLNYDQLLMLTDTINCRFMTILSCLLNYYLKSDELPDPDLVRRVYVWGDNLIKKHGCSAYYIIEAFEDIVTNSFVNFPESDPLGLGVTFKETLLESALEKCCTYKVPLEGTLQLIRILEDIWSVNILSEIFGLRKHWGNPMVSAEASSRAVIEKITEDLPVSGIGLTNLHASFNRMIVLEYIKQNGEWPKGEFLTSSTLKTYPLERAFKSGVTRLPEISSGHCHMHWSLFVFHPNCTLDSFLNPLDLITDKSVSLYRDHLDCTFSRQLSTVKWPKRFDEQRRLVLEYLRTEKMPVVEILRSVMSGNIPVDWLANSACMKGTEMKHEKARLFAVLTYEMRQYFVATEELIKTHIFRYNPHQTMTMDEPSLMTRLREVTKQMDVTSGSRYLSVMHIIDFSKWNLRMKYSNTSSVFRSIDDFLGTPGLVEMSHIIFSSMLNIVQDSYHPPAEGVKGTEDDKVWRFHNRGWEGQRQKGWTALTSALLSDLQRRTGVKSLICGQGDNQTLLSSFRIPDRYRNAEEWITEAADEVRSLIDSFYALLSSECESVGLKVKTGESCRSLCYFNYGKRLFFKGVELSMVLKRISKNMTEGNSSYPITESILKTIQGSSTASGLFSHQSVIPVIVGRLSTLMQIVEAYVMNPLLGNKVSELFQDRSVQINLKLCSLISRIPPVLGGPSQPCFLDYFFRGHPDPAAGEFAMITLLARAGNEFERKMVFSTSAEDSWLYNNRKDDKTSLIAAPFSLNLKMPLSARRPVADMIYPAIVSFCKNSQIRELFSKSAVKEEDLLYSILGNIEPFSPLIANDIFSRTPSGRRLSFLSGLTNTTSLGRLVVDSRSSSVVTKVMQLEFEQLEHWVRLVERLLSTQVPISWHTREHHLHLQEARERSWGCVIEGVTVPHPVEQFILTEARHDICSDSCLTALPEHIVFASTKDHLYGPRTPTGLNHPLVCRCRGLDPFLGNTITEGVIQKQLICLNPDSSWVDVLRINIIRMWVTRDGTLLNKLLLDLIRLRTDTPMEIIGLATGKPSRISYNHRAALMATVKTCSPSCTTNFQSRFYISSNRMGNYSHGDTNYHMPFGPCFLFFTYCLGLKSALCGIDNVLTGSRTVFHAHVRTPNIPAVYDGDIILSRPSDLGSRLSQTPPILFREFTSLTFQLVDQEVRSTLWNDFGATPMREARRSYAHQLLGDLLVSEIIYHESSIGLTKCDYPAQPNKISAGDISLVGLDNFLHAISETVLLMAPIYIFGIESNSGTAQALTDYLGSFSSSFWELLAEPFRVPRLTEQLLRWAPQLASQDLTRSLGGVSSTLRRVVTSYTGFLLGKHKTQVRSYSRSTPLKLRAPTLRVLKLLVSRYFEISVLCIPATGRPMMKERSFLARDIGTNLNCIDPSQLRFSLRTALRDFSTISAKLGSIRSSTLPVPVFFNLTEPWIDMVRLTPPQPTLALGASEVDYPYTWRLRCRSIHCYIGDHERVQEYVTCRCPQFVGAWGLRTECISMDTGILSKSHYRFCEIIFSHKLDVRSVICLGSSTGTEAAAISRIRECREVFINCLRPLNEFSPHAAATYVPTGYLLDGIAEKLISSGQSAIAPNDLLLPESLDAIIHLVEGRIWTGITCDVELSESQYQNDQLILVVNLCSLIKRLTVSTTFWVIIKIGVDCCHQLHRLLFPLASIFHDISVIRSNFARAGSRLIMVLCQNRKSSGSLLIGQGNTNPIYESMHTDNFGREILNSRSSEKNPGYIDQHKESRVDLSTIHKLASASLLSACSVYLPGFAFSSYEVSNRSTAKMSLVRYIDSCSLTVRELVGTYARANKELSMIRSGILMIDDVGLGGRLQAIGYRLFKAKMLYRCLSMDELSLQEVELIVSQELSGEVSLRIGSIRYIIKIDATRFIHVTSRYLCEILGSLFNHRLSVCIARNNPPFHRVELGCSFVTHTSVWLETPMCKTLPVFDTKWRWEDRAIILSALSFITYQDRFPSESLSCCVPNSFMFIALNIKLRSAGFESVLEITDDMSKASLIWIDKYSLSSLPQVSKSRFLYLLIEVVNLNRIIGSMNIFCILRVPWLGIVPRRVMAIVSFAPSHVNIQHNDYPCLEEMSRWVNEQGKVHVGCSCNDCNSEFEIVTPFALSTRDINQLCGWKKITTVFDKFH